MTDCSEVRPGKWQDGSLYYATFGAHHIPSCVWFLTLEVKIIIRKSTFGHDSEPFHFSSYILRRFFKIHFNIIISFSFRKVPET
jgi:hypothetical protein